MKECVGAATCRPQSRALLADSHVHLLDHRLADCIDETMQNLTADGLAFVVEVAPTFDSSKRAVDLASKYDRIYATIGIHPHDAKDYTAEFETWSETTRGNRKVVAVGECGLDYHYMHSPKETQHNVFIAQIKLAHKLGLPLVVHSRSAYDDTLSILRSNRKYLTNGILFHCFGYCALEVAELTKEFDAYFAFGGALTHKKKDAMVDAMRAVPFSRLLLETDCPYLAPEPLRGTCNCPRNVRYVAEFVAKTLNLPFEQVASQTLANTKRFYRIKEAS